MEIMSLFSGGGSKPNKDNGSFDLNSLIGSVAGSTQKTQGSKSKSGVENLLDVSSQEVDRKKFIPVKKDSKPAPKTSSNDVKKSKDDYSSQSHRNGHSDSSKIHKKDERPRDSSRDHRDSDRSKQSSHHDRGDKKSSHEDYNPLSNDRGRSSRDNDTFDVPIKKKPADSHDGKNGEYSPKIKKVTEPSSPKIKKADPSIKRPEVSPSKPKAPQTLSSKPNGDSSFSKSSNSSHAVSKDSKSLQQKPQRPSESSIPKKPQSGTSQASSRPSSAKPTSSSPGPSKSPGARPVTPGSLSGKPSSMSKPVPSKTLALAKPGQKPISSGSMGSKPLSKPVSAASGSRPVSSQSGAKKTDFTAPMPKPSSQRPVSQSPKPVAPGRALNAVPPGSKEALRKQMEAKERMRKEAAGQGKRPMELAKPNKPTSNLGKRPLDRPDSRVEPPLVKKLPMSKSEKNQTLNSIFKGKKKPGKRYDSDSDDYDDNDSFIDDGDEAEAREAQEELNRMMSGYRRRVIMSKPFERDVDDMEVGYDRIQKELEWTEHVGKIEDQREAVYIKKEMEEEMAMAQKKKRKLKI